MAVFRYMFLTTIGGRLGGFVTTRAALKRVRFEGDASPRFVMRSECVATSSLCLKMKPSSSKRLASSRNLDNVRLLAVSLAGKTGVSTWASFTFHKCVRTCFKYISPSLWFHDNR